MADSILTSQLIRRLKSILIYYDCLLQINNSIFYYNVIQGSPTPRLSLDREGERPGSCEVDVCSLLLACQLHSCSAVHT